MCMHIEEIDIFIYRDTGERGCGVNIDIRQEQNIFKGKHQTSYNTR